MVNMPHYCDDGWHIHAFEALVRGLHGTNMESPEVLFEYVRRKGAERLVDRHCVTEILTAAVPLGRDAQVGINVHASTLEQDGGFARFLGDAATEHGVQPSRIIVEIVEHSPSWSGRKFQDALAGLREVGFRIALDDIGLGQSNYRMILECRPDYFKMDRFLITGSYADYYRRAVIRSITELAESFGATAVAEGIDNPDDLEAVLNEGVTTVQGYLLARPAAASTLGNSTFVESVARRMPKKAKQAPWASATDWVQLISKQVVSGSGSAEPAIVC